MGAPEAASSPHGTQPTGGPARQAAPAAPAAKPGTGNVGDPPRTAGGEAPTSISSSGGRALGRSDEVVDSPARDGAVAGPTVGASPHAVGAPPTLPRASVGHGEPPTAITVSAADAFKVPRADPYLPGKLPAVSAPVPKPSVSAGARSVGPEASFSASGVGTREVGTPTTTGAASRATDGAPATSSAGSGTPGVAPRSPGAGVRSPEAGRPAGAEPVRSAPIDRSEIRSDAGGAGPVRGELDTVARNMSDRHTELISAKAARAERIPDPTEAAAARRATMMAEARGQFWSSVREGMAAQFGPHAGRLASQNRQTLERFAAFFAGEAGVAKELPAVRTMIGREFSVTVPGEMAGAVKTVAADIVRRAGLPAARFDPLVSRLGSTNRAEFAQAMNDFRSAIRDHRTEQARGGRYNAGTDRPTTLDQARTTFDADAKAAAARDARAAAGERSDPQSARVADDAAQVRRQVETEARNWASVRDKEFTTLSKSIGKQFADERYATAYVQREQRVEYRPGHQPEKALDDAVTHINRRWEAAVRSASAIQRFRPDADAAFNAEALATSNIAGLTKVAGAPRLRSLEALPEKEAAEWRTSFRNAVDNEFERVWRPVYEAGHGPGSARFQAAEDVWAARFQGMREQLRVDGFAYHEMQRVADDIAEARADLAFRGGSADDVTQALQVIREKYHAEIGDLVSGIGRRGPDLARWDDLAVRMQTEVRRAFTPEAMAGRRPVEPERIGGDPFTGRRPVPDGPPASARHPDLVGVRDQAIRDFGTLDPLAQAKLPRNMLDRLEATYVHERLTAYDGIMHGGDARVPAHVLHDLRVEARPPAGEPAASFTRHSPASWTEHRRQINELLYGRGLAVTPTSGGLVVHVDAVQAAADSAVVRAVRGLDELPDGLRIVAGPGVRPEVDLAGLGPLARDGMVLYAPFLSDSALVEVARSTGLTVAFRGRPAPGEAVAHPVDGNGLVTLQHLAAEWRSGVAAVDAPFGLTASAQPGLYRLSEGWTLESHSWGVWARPTEVSVYDAFRTRLGELSGDRPVVVGASGIDVPDAVVREIHHLMERMPASERSGITWLSRPGGRETSPHLLDNPADPTTSARTQKYGDAFDIAETRRLVLEQAGRDVRSVELNLDLPSSAAADKLLRAYEADAEALIGKYLSGKEGWHGHADFGGFARGYEDLRLSLPGRLDAQVRWEGRAGDLRRSVEEAFHRDARPRDRTELFPETGPAQTVDHVTAFWERFSATAGKTIDDLAKGGPRADLGAAVDARITELARDIRLHADAYLTGESALAHGLGRSRAFGDEVRPGGDAVADEIVTTLSSQTRNAFNKVFGPDGAFGVERWKPGSTFAGSAEARQLDDVFAPENLATVEKRVRDAFESLLRSAPDIEGSISLPARLAAAHHASARLEQAAAARAEVRQAAGLRPDVTAQQLARFQDDLIARVDDSLISEVDDGVPSGSRRGGGDGDGPRAGDGDRPRGGGSPEEARARFEELTGDRLATDLDTMTEPHPVRFTRDDLMLRLDDVAGPLDRAGVDRVARRLAADLRRAFDEIDSSGRSPLGANEAWARKVDEFRAGLPGRVEAELDSLTNLKIAAQEFHFIERAAAARSGAPLRSDLVTELAAAHRADFMAARDRNLTNASDRTTWLGNEKANGDRYGSQLNYLRRGSFVEDLEWRLDADLRAAVDRVGGRGVERAEPEAAAAAIRRSFADEMHGARYSDNFTSVWEKRYRSLSDSIDTQLTVVMMERRVKDIADELLAPRADKLPETELRRLGEVVTKEFGAALRGRASGHLPPSLGVSEQRALLREIRPAVKAEVSRLLVAEGIGEPVRDLVSDVVTRVSRKLSSAERVPTSVEAGFAGELKQVAARLDDTIAEVLSRPTPALTDASRATSAAVVRAEVLAELNVLHQRNWNFDRGSWAHQFDETLSGIGRRIDSFPLRQETEQLLAASLKRDVPEALAALDRNSVGRNVLVAAGRAFTSAVTAEFQRMAATTTFTLPDVNRWNARYGQLIGSFDSWVTTYLVGDRVERLVVRHVRGAQGTLTEVDADRLARVEQRLQQVVRETLAPYLTMSAHAILPPSIGVEEQVTLAREIGARLEQVPVAEDMSPLAERVVQSLRQHPVAARPGAGLAAEREALGLQVEVRLRDVLAAYAPGAPVQEALSAFTDRVRERFDALATTGWAFDRGVLANQMEADLADADAFVAAYVRRADDRSTLPSIVRRRLAEALRHLPPPSMNAVVQFTTEVAQEFDRAHPVNHPYGDREVADWQARLDDMFERLGSWLVAHRVGARAVESVGPAEQAAVRQALQPYLRLSSTSPLPASMGSREQEMLGRTLLAGAPSAARDAFAADLLTTPVPTRPGTDFAARRAGIEERLDAALTEVKVAVKDQARQFGTKAARKLRGTGPFGISAGRVVLRHLDVAVEDYRREVLASVDAAFERDWRAPDVTIGHQLTTATSAVTRRMVRAYAVAELERDLTTDIVGPAADGFRAAVLTQVTADVAAGDEFGPAQQETWRRNYRRLIDRSQAWQTIRVLADRARTLAPGSVWRSKGWLQRSADAIEKVVEPYLNLNLSDWIRPVRSLGMPEQGRLAGELARVMPQQAGDLLRASVHVAPVQADPAWAGSFFPTDFGAERVQLGQRLLREVPGTDAATEAFRADQLRRFDAVNEADWSFDRAAWDADLARRLEAKGDWISSWQRRAEARVQFGANLNLALNVALGRLPASAAATRAAYSFYNAAVDEFEATYPVGSPFTLEQDGAWRQRLGQLTSRIGGWLTMRQIGNQIRHRIDDTLIHTHGPLAADHPMWEVADRMVGQIDDAMDGHLNLRSTRYLPAVLSPQEQAALAAYLARRLRQEDAARIGLNGDPSEAARRWLHTDPVPVPIGDDHAGQRTRLQERLDQIPGDPAAVAAHRVAVLRDFDEAHARWWNLDVGTWPNRLTTRLRDAPAWIDAFTRRVDARMGTEASLRPDLDAAVARSGLTTDQAVDVDAALVTTVTREFDSRFSRDGAFGEAERTWWAGRLERIRSRLDAWIAVRTVALSVREIAPTVEAGTIDRVLRPYLDIAGIETLPALFGPAERDALIGRVVPHLVGGAADATIIELFRSRVPAQEGVGFAVERAALNDRLAEVLAARRADSETGAAAEAASEAFRARVLAGLDSRFAGNWNFDRLTWRQEYDRTIDEMATWIDAFTRRVDARMGTEASLRPDLDAAVARSGLTTDQAVDVDAALVTTVTREFDSRFSRDGAFGEAERTWWAGRLERIRSRLDAWIAVRTVALSVREIAPTVEAGTIDRVLRPYLDIAGIETLPALFGPAERDALIGRVVPHLVGGAADATIIELFRSRVPAQEGVGFAVERAALNDRLAEVLAARRADSETGAAAEAASEAFRARVLAGLDSRFAGNWNFDRLTWRQEYDRTIDEMATWFDNWAAGDRLRNADRDALRRVLDENAADQPVREAILGAFDQHYANYTGSTDSVGIARTRWQARQARIIDGLDEHRQRTELTGRLTDQIDSAVANQRALWRDAGVADWELDQLTELDDRLMAGLGAAQLARRLPDQGSARPVADLTEQLDRAVGTWADGGLISPAVRSLAARLRAALVHEVRDALGEPESAQEPPAPAIPRLTTPDFAADFRRQVLRVNVGPLRAHHLEMAQDFARDAAQLFDRPAIDALEATARADYHDLIQRFRAQEPFYDRVIAFRRDAGDVAALRERLDGGNPQLGNRVVAEFEQGVRRLVGQAWVAAQYEGSPVDAAFDLFKRYHPRLVDGARKRMTELREAEELRARADELITTQLRDFETEHGDLDPQARMIARYAAQTHVVPAHRDLGAGAVEALHGQFRLAGGYSRFVADLPAGTPEAVRREGLDAYARLLGGPADSADQLERVLTVLAEQARRQVVVEERLAALASDQARLSTVLGPVPADDERMALEGFLRARLDEASAHLVDDIRTWTSAARYAPDHVDAALGQLDADLDRAVEHWADNEALRALARIPEGRDFLRGPGTDGLDDILSALARDASPQALASLPYLLAALPSMGAESAAVLDLLTNVGQFLEGDADAYTRAFERAADVRVRSRGALMEFVMALHVLDPELIALGNRIMDC
ncbi:hypothetical protein ACFYL6_20240 [Micromonospora sp. NPDC007208]|uniref:hypothetical protein n=1 Tax=Micromonospora sp. NPDC007208 TaxID=3364236 RepID=UPI0036760A0C